MITQKLSKEEIIAGIKEQARRSTIGKNACKTGVYTVNEFYVLKK